MKHIILLFFAAINIYSLININVSYEHDQLIALLSTRIIFMAISIILSALFVIAGAPRSLKILAGATILTGLVHFISILLIYI